MGGRGDDACAGCSGTWPEWLVHGEVSAIAPTWLGLAVLVALATLSLRQGELHCRGGLRSLFVALDWRERNGARESPWVLVAVAGREDEARISAYLELLLMRGDGKRWDGELGR